METKGECGAEIRRRISDSRNSETHEWGLAGRSRFQIPHCEELQKPKPGVSDSLYPRIMRNTRNGEERTRRDHGQSNQIRPNQTESRPIETEQGQFQIKAQAARSNLGRANLDFGRARWMQRSSERMNGNANCLRACFKISRGPVFGQKAGSRGATREALRAATTEQLRRHSRAGRRQTAFCPKTLRAAGLLPVAGVGSFLTARCGDARNSPPWPRAKSLAAGLLLILKQALSDRNTCFIYDTGERGSVKVRLGSPGRELEFGHARLRPRQDGA